MPCIFCIAAVAMIAGAIATAVADRIEAGLADQSDGAVRRTVETDSVTKWELDVRVGRTAVPVAVTLFKDSGRVRIQVLKHVLSTQEIALLFARLCAAIGAELVSSSDPQHEAEEPHDHDEPDLERDDEREAGTDEADRQRTTADPRAARRERR